MRGLKKTQTITIAKKEGWYLSFPDVLRFPEGKMICVFRQSDVHYPPTAPQTELLLMDSFDDGLSWENEREFSHYPRDHQKWAWHCARLSHFSDGKVAMVCDLAGPEYGPPEIFVSFSEDQGITWSDPIETGVLGIMPDRLLEFSAKDWGFAAQWYRPEDVNSSLPLTQRFYCTEDGGQSWGLRGVVAEDDYRAFCEASICRHSDGRLFSFLRENSFLHQPTYVTSSSDNGRTWSKPEIHPSFGHRHCSGFVGESKLLLTYRSVSGNPGLDAWLGDIGERGFQVAGKDLSGDGLAISNEAMSISSSGRKDEGVEFPLFPLLSWESSFSLKARVKRVSGDKNSCVLRGAGALRILEDKIVFLSRSIRGTVEVEELGSYQLDTSDFHLYEIRYESGELRVLVDEQEVISAKLEQPLLSYDRKVSFGNLSMDPPNIVSFQGHQGTSLWQSVDYVSQHPLIGELSWSWSSSSGAYPNSYERERVLRIDPEESLEWGESGYSGWVSLDDTRVYCINYRRGDEDFPYIVGYMLELSA